MERGTAARQSDKTADGGVGLVLMCGFVVYGSLRGFHLSAEKWRYSYGPVGTVGAAAFTALQAIQVVIPILPGGIGCLGGVLMFAGDGFSIIMWASASARWRLFCYPSGTGSLLSGLWRGERTYRKNTPGWLEREQV